MVSFVQNSERVTEVIFNCSLGSDTYLIFGGWILIANLPAFAGLLGFRLIGDNFDLLLIGVTRTCVFSGIRVLGVRSSLICLLVWLFGLLGRNSVAH